MAGVVCGEARCSRDDEGVLVGVALAAKRQNLPLHVVYRSCSVMIFNFTTIVDAANVAAHTVKYDESSRGESEAESESYSRADCECLTGTIATYATVDY